MTTENESKRLREFFFASIKTGKRIVQKTLPDLEETARYCQHLKRNLFHYLGKLTKKKIKTRLYFVSGRKQFKLLTPSFKTITLLFAKGLKVRFALFV